MSEGFSLTGALPLMRSGTTVWNAVFGIIHVCLLGVWPLIGTDTIGIKSDHSTDWLSGIENGDGVAGRFRAAFAQSHVGTELSRLPRQ